METTQDLRVDRSGGIYILKPLNDEGQYWLDCNVVSEPWQWDRGGLCVDRRCADAIIDAAQDDGLTVSSN